MRKKRRFLQDTSRCTTFGADSALMDYDSHGSWNRRGGHQRFTRIGWAVGGEFALYLLRPISVV